MKLIQVIVVAFYVISLFGLQCICGADMDDVEEVLDDVDISSKFAFITYTVVRLLFSFYFQAQEKPIAQNDFC